MQVWPAVNHRSGKCVRLCRGELAARRAGDELPVNAAPNGCDNGDADVLSIFDLAGLESDAFQDFALTCPIAGQANFSIHISVAQTDGVVEFATVKFGDCFCGAALSGDRSMRSQAVLFNPRHSSNTSEENALVSATGVSTV